ncbi:hypothetical protein C8R43DRAFT_977771 [Mycena crocata]|nr:hypothetical protein C8R43DRAFT_977771 [Mycena crocata]
MTSRLSARSLHMCFQIMDFGLWFISSCYVHARSLPPMPASLPMFSLPFLHTYDSIYVGTHAPPLYLSLVSVYFAFRVLVYFT